MFTFSCRIVCVAWVIGNPLTTFAAMTKWVDANGLVHYGDQVPPQYSDRAQEQLNKQGLTVKTYRAAKTKAELAAEAALAEREQNAAQTRKQQESRDRILLGTYEDETDLNNALTSQLSSFNDKIKNLNTHILRTERKIIDNQRKAADYEKAGQPVPTTLTQEMTNLQTAINDNQQAILRLQGKKQELTAKFAEDLLRLKQLKARERVFKARANMRTGPDIHKNAYPCRNIDECETGWGFAKNYLASIATRHHLASPQIDSEIALQTAEATNGQTFAVLISREFFKTPGGRIMIYLECQDSSAGRDLCSSHEVRKIAQGFRRYIETQSSLPSER